MCFLFIYCMLWFKCFFGLKIFKAVWFHYLFSFFFYYYKFTYYIFRLQKNRSDIPCYWEAQPSGCLKTFCPFFHNEPRPSDQPPSVSTDGPVANQAQPVQPVLSRPAVPVSLPDASLPHSSAPVPGQGMPMPRPGAPIHCPSAPLPQPGAPVAGLGAPAPRPSVPQPGVPVSVIPSLAGRDTMKIPTISTGPRPRPPLQQNVGMPRPPAPMLYPGSRPLPLLLMPQQPQMVRTPQFTGPPRSTGIVHPVSASGGFPPAIPGGPVSYARGMLNLWYLELTKEMAKLYINFF